MSAANRRRGSPAVRAGRAIGRFYGLALCAAFLGGFFGFLAGASSVCGAVVFGNGLEDCLVAPFAAGYGMFVGAINGVALSPFFAAGMWRSADRTGPVIGWTCLAAAVPGVLPFPVSIFIS